MNVLFSCELEGSTKYTGGARSICALTVCDVKGNRSSSSYYHVDDEEVFVAIMLSREHRSDKRYYGDKRYSILIVSGIVRDSEAVELLLM